jgi:hypothetical protein
MPFFCKKPIIVEAFKVPPEGFMISVEMEKFLEDCKRDIENTGDGGIFIHTLEGRMEARPGDWIIKGINGEFYPCKPDIFAATYDEANTRPSTMESKQ